MNNENTKKVTIVPAPEQPPIEIPWQEGLTVAAAIKQAGIEVGDGECPVIGEEAIGDPETTILQPGQEIVIDVLPANG